MARGKTNKQWYPYVTFGSYFKLENGDLMQCPMNTDGTRDDNPCFVDWLEVNAGEPEDKAAMERIEKELQERE